MNLIRIEVTEDIAAKIRSMAEAGVFSIITGNASLNFHEGVLKSVKTEIITHIKSYPHPIDVVPVDRGGKLMKSV